MPIIDIPLDSIPDAKYLDPGEHQMRLAGYSIGPSKEGNRQLLKVQLACVADPTAETVFDNISLPTAEDPEKTKLFLKRRFKAFFMCFGGNARATKPDPDSIRGNQGWVQIALDNEAGMRNVVTINGYTPPRT